MYKIIKCTQKSFVGKVIEIDNGHVHICGGKYRVAKVTIMGDVTVIDATNIIFHTEEI